VPDSVVDTAAALERALSAPGWLLLGVLLHLANQVARGRGWYALLRPACPGVRRRDAIAAWVAGAAAGGVTFARGGDALRVLMLNRRVPGAKPAVITGTLVAETAGELATGAACLGLALAVGAGPHVPRMWLTAGLTAAALAGAAWVAAKLVRRRRAAAGIVAAEPCGWRRRVLCVFARVGKGCAALPPGEFARGVVPWQMLSRVCRLGALACFLAAFGLPATPAAVLLVVFAQGGGRLVPFAPASVGAGAAVLAASFQPVTGAAVPAADVAAFFIGTSAVLTIVCTAVASVILLRDQALTSAGRSAWLRVRTRTRVAAAPRT
jgi:uncharacterized membrane protein YbhN (UPF0104 family)